MSDEEEAIDDEMEEEVEDAGEVEEVADEEVVSYSDSASSLASKEAERQRIQAEIAEFLARGGKISTIPNNVVADPPKKPESNYGSQPI